MMTDLRTLPIGERIRLVEDLWDSIAADQGQLPITEAQRVELDRRLDAFERDGDKGRGLNEVIAAVKSKL